MIGDAHFSTGIVFDRSCYFYVAVLFVVARLGGMDVLYLSLPAFLGPLVLLDCGSWKLILPEAFAAEADLPEAGLAAGFCDFIN